MISRAWSTAKIACSFSVNARKSRPEVKRSIRPILSRISPRRRSSLSEGKDRLFFDLAPQRFLTDRLRHEIDRTAENFSQTLDQRGEPTEIGKAAALRLAAQPNHDIDVRSAGRLAARDGPEDRKAVDAGRAQLCLVRTQSGDDLVPIHVAEFSRIDCRVPVSPASMPSPNAVRSCSSGG